ncbi:MAG: hypothetical protein IJ123_02615 [Blautia sp.]|nr:hypothetical protein [Blautia sp.]
MALNNDAKGAQASALYPADACALLDAGLYEWYKVYMERGHEKYGQCSWLKTEKT